MSRFFSEQFRSVTPYVPGEQPKDKKYIKLNTNESPFPPSPKAQAYAKQAAEGLQLYSDPECKVLREKAAKRLGVDVDEIVFTNGSDEILNFAFMAFCDKNHGVAFPDISYGFYSVFAALHHIPAKEIPLREDFSIDYRDYCNVGCAVVIANPNAPTGLALPLCEIEEIVKNLDNSNLVRGCLIIAGSFATMFKKPKQPPVANKKALYQKAYPEFIREPFADEPKLEKRFYEAVHDYNRNKPASAVAKDYRVHCSRMRPSAKPSVFSTPSPRICP